MPHSILFLGKKGDDHCLYATDFCRQIFGDVSVCLGGRGEPIPDDIAFAAPDYIISYLCPWIIPESLLKRAKIAAINFHPAPPEYPGTGCINFALYDEAKEYGVTCHHMAKTVDSGPIISAVRFPVFDNDSVLTLLRRTYDHQLALFYAVAAKLAQGEMPISKEQWNGKPHTRRDLDALSVIDCGMSRDEVKKRIRATAFGPWRPKVALHGFVFELASSDCSLTPRPTL